MTTNFILPESPEEIDTLVGRLSEQILENKTLKEPNFIDENANTIRYTTEEDVANIGEPSRFKLVKNSSDILTNWKSATPLASELQTTWKSLAYGNGTFVAVANDKSMYSMDGGENWTVSGLTTGDWRSVCYGNGIFVAVGVGLANTYFSRDGISWTASKNIIEDGSTVDLYAVDYGENHFVAVGNYSNDENELSFFSSDGANWQEGHIVEGTSDHHTYKSVAYGNGTFVAVGGANDDLMTECKVSGYGQSWSTRTIISGDGKEFIKVCFGNGMFIALPASGSACYISKDLGVSWTASILPSNEESWLDLCYGNGRFFLITSSSTNKIYYSFDGINWKEEVIETTVIPTCILFGKDRNILLTNSANVFYYPHGKLDIAHDEDEIYYTINKSITWNTAPISVNCQDVCYGNGKFVAVGWSSIAGYSYDGINWNTAPITSASLSSVCYGNGKFVALAYNNNIAVYSYDGINWNTTSIAHAYWGSVCYGNGKFVAVGYKESSSSIVGYSYDGINWNTTPITTAYWSSVCYGNGKFVAVGYGDSSSIVGYSYDGINWNIISIATANWRSVCYGNGKFVAVGHNNFVGYSYDGINWNTTPITNANWRSVCYGNGKFVAVGNGNNIAGYSYDGINWNIISIASALWRSVCYGNGKFVTVAYNDFVGYSYDSFIKTDFPIIAPNIPANLENHLQIFDNNSHSWQQIYPIGSVYITTETDANDTTTFPDILNNRFGFGTWSSMGSTTVGGYTVYWYCRTA